MRYEFRIAVRYKFLVYCDISIYWYIVSPLPDTPSITIALDTIIPYIRINNQMKFEHAATPFRYILYVHTGSLHKKFINHVENFSSASLMYQHFDPPPPPKSVRTVRTKICSPPLRIKWSRHKVAILTSFWTFFSWIYYRYILHGLKISLIHLKRLVIHLKRSVIHLKIS